MNSLSREKIEQDVDFRLDWLNPDGIFAFDAIAINTSFPIKIQINQSDWEKPLFACFVYIRLRIHKASGSSR